MPQAVRNTASLSTFTRWWKSTNLPDYLGFFLLLAAWIGVAKFGEPFHRMFFINDLRISYPHAEIERVSVGWNFVYALYIPLGFFLLVNLLSRCSLTKHEATILPFAISIVLTAFITATIKNAVGRPRPDLLARCQPEPGTKPNVLVSISVCTAPEGHTLREGWRSFPSGHSSFAFAGLGFTALWLAGQMRVGAPGGRDLLRAVACMVPLLGALMIAISRCEDYRHDVYDVSVGSLLGMGVAYWSYRRYWPGLGAARCHEPIPKVAAEEQSETGWQRVRDEEEGGQDREESRNGPVGYELDNLDDVTG